MRGRQHVHTVTHYGHRIQNSTVQDAVQPMKHSSESLHPVYWGNDTVECIFFFFFITDPRGVGSVVSRAICPAARPLRVLVPVPGCVFTGIIQQQIVYLLHVS